MSPAQQLDDVLTQGHAAGPLHGLPVGIKDIVDVAGLPCENGTTLDQGRRPQEDAELVTALRSAGALIMGKTVTTELAYFSPGKTRNPHDVSRTPGGSSSGSAAAVAAGMVPLAIGSQTNGSVIRPASFCGIVGFKPTRGLISTKGVLRQAQNLDTIGAFANCVDDVAALTDVIACSGSNQNGTGIDLLTCCQSDPPSPPRFAYVKTPVWEMAEEATQSGFEALVKRIGAQVESVELPPNFDNGHAAHFQINMVEIAKNFDHYAVRGLDQLSRKMQTAIDEGHAISAPNYLRALDCIDELNAGLDAIFNEYDAIITPAAVGEAPVDLNQTGNPAFCTLWTLCGTPAISLPLLKGPNGLPIGVQLVARVGDDARLLRTARWLEQSLD